jgi:hypothetical protein
MTIIVVRFLSGLDIWLPEAYFDHWARFGGWIEVKLEWM